MPDLDPVEVLRQTVTTGGVERGVVRRVSPSGWLVELPHGSVQVSRYAGSDRLTVGDGVMVSRSAGSPPVIIGRSGAPKRAIASFRLARSTPPELPPEIDQGSEDEPLDDNTDAFFARIVRGLLKYLSNNEVQKQLFAAKLLEYIVDRFEDNASERADFMNALLGTALSESYYLEIESKTQTDITYRHALGRIRMQRADAGGDVWTETSRTTKEVAVTSKDGCSMSVQRVIEIIFLDKNGGTRRLVFK